MGGGGLRFCALGWKSSTSEKNSPALLEVVLEDLPGEKCGGTSVFSLVLKMDKNLHGPIDAI